VGKVAVVGPLGDDPVDQLGPDVPIGYDTSSPNFQKNDQIVTVAQGIGKVVGAGNVTAVNGCATFTVADPCNEPDTTAVQTAAKSSAVTVIVVGEPAGDSGEASSRSDIGLPGQQQALIDAVKATGQPYVVVLMNGRPLTIPQLGGDPTTHAGGVPALLEAWFPGTTGGDAVADVLFGNVDPGGKLPMSFPQNVGQVPMSYNELPTGRPYDPNNKYTSKYLDVTNAPEFPFGYGLSYTTFSISSPQIVGTPSRNGTFRVRATIANTGPTAGDDVVQLYIHEDDTSILQPVERLEGFQRVSLAKGGSQTVTFKLGPQNLGFYDNNGQFGVQPGPFKLWVSDSSDVSSVTPATFTVR
jgi:beta-glucosidase